MVDASYILLTGRNCNAYGLVGGSSGKQSNPSLDTLSAPGPLWELLLTHLLLRRMDFITALLHLGKWKTAQSNVVVA